MAKRTAAVKSDEQLAAEAKGGSAEAQEALLQKYKGMVLARARLYFMLGADRDDVVQEGMIGLFNAMGSYDPERGSSFAAFASLCVDRHILSAVRSAGRLKNGPLNESLSFSSPLADGETELGDSIPAGPGSDPETQAIYSDLYGIIHGSDIFSPLEKKVLAGLEQGLTMAEISEACGREPRSVSNAVQRIRRKLQKLLT